MTALRQFLLLMWKHFHLRKHRWFLTSVEIILPIVIAYLLCSKGGKFLGESPTIQEATIELEENFKEIMARTPYLKIMYTPENVFTKDLMSKAKEYAGKFPLNITIVSWRELLLQKLKIFCHIII